MKLSGAVFDDMRNCTRVMDWDTVRPALSATAAEWKENFVSELIGTVPWSLAALHPTVQPILSTVASKSIDRQENVAKWATRPLGWTSGAGLMAGISSAGVDALATAVGHGFGPKVSRDSPVWVASTIDEIFGNHAIVSLAIYGVASSGVRLASTYPLERFALLIRMGQIPRRRDAMCLVDTVLASVLAPRFGDACAMLVPDYGIVAHLAEIPAAIVIHTAGVASRTCNEHDPFGGLARKLLSIGIYRGSYLVVHRVLTDTLRESNGPLSPLSAAATAVAATTVAALLTVPIEAQRERQIALSLIGSNRGVHSNDGWSHWSGRRVIAAWTALASRCMAHLQVAVPISIAGVTLVLMQRSSVAL